MAKSFRLDLPLRETDSEPVFFDDKRANASLIQYFFFIPRELFVSRRMVLRVRNIFSKYFCP